MKQRAKKLAPWIIAAACFGWGLTNELAISDLKPKAAKLESELGQCIGFAKSVYGALIECSQAYTACTNKCGEI